jgi:hypothetical protein
LKVDGQIKRSFSSKEDAASAGAKIKKAYPIVVVTVVDTKNVTTEIIDSYRGRAEYSCTKSDAFALNCLHVSEHRQVKRSA